MLHEIKGRSARGVSLREPEGWDPEMVILLEPKGLNLIKWDSTFSSAHLLVFKFIIQYFLLEVRKGR